MGQAGPAGKSIAEHKRHGTYRQDRHGNVDLPNEPPPMPGDIGPRAQVFWRQMIENAEFAGVLSRVDGPALRLMAESWEVYLDAQEELSRNGIVVTQVTQAGENSKANPAIVIRNQAWKQIIDGLRQFGMTPASRHGMHISGESGQTEGERDVAAILGIGRG